MKNKSESLCWDDIDRMVESLTGVSIVTHGRYTPISALCLASSVGDIKNVKELLKDAGIDISANNNAAICEAFYCNHWEIVKLLLNDYRFRIDDSFIQCMKNSKKLKKLVPQIMKDLYL